MGIHWVEEPEEDMRRALRKVGLRLPTRLQWDFRSDLLLARIVACIFKDELRAHPTGV